MVVQTETALPRPDIYSLLITTPFAHAGVNDTNSITKLTQAKLIGGTSCANVLPADGGATGGEGREGGGDGEYPFIITVPFVNHAGGPLDKDPFGNKMLFEDDPLDDGANCPLGVSEDSLDIDRMRVKKRSLVL
jgi:hypothetical protein